MGIRMAGQPTDWAERTYHVGMSEQSAGPVPPPEITPAMRASARANPNTWLYVIDPALDADADVPPWGVVGAYPVGADGEIVRAFRRNTAYRPSPAALRMPEPSSDLERTLQLVSVGHVLRGELPAAGLRAPRSAARARAPPLASPRLPRPRRLGGRPRLHVGGLRTHGVA